MSSITGSFLQAWTDDIADPAKEPTDLPPTSIAYNPETNTLVVKGEILVSPVVVEPGLRVQLGGCIVTKRADGKERAFTLLRHQQPHIVTGKKRVAAAVRAGGRILIGSAVILDDHADGLLPAI